MSLPPFILPCLTVALTQLFNQWLTRVISLYICTPKTHICARYLTRCVITNINNNNSNNSNNYTSVPPDWS